MKRIIVFAAFTVSVCFAKSQNYYDLDAIRYSQSSLGGTARSMSMGGAFGALGGDFTSLSINPAGIGFYSKSELTFSPSLLINNSTTSYLDQSSKINRTTLNFTNAGLIFTYRNEDKDSKWLNFNFGFGYNRTNDFNSRVSYSNPNSPSSLTDNFAGDIASNGTNGGSPEAQAAYQSFLVDTFGTGYHSTLPAGNLARTRTLTKYGSIGEYVFSFGANYNDNLYLGATLGITSLNYEQNSNYSEAPVGGGANYFLLNQDFKTTGTGFNAKIGAIFRPIDWFRVGLAYHLPTYYALEDNDDILITNYTNYNYGATGSSKSTYSYNLTTPGKAVASIAVVILKQALVSTDIEFIDYSTASFSSDDNTFSSTNNYISQNYGSCVNYRLGAEYKIDKSISVRAGYAYYSNPYNSTTAPAIGVNGAQANYTLGLGIRNSGYFFDFAYILQKTQDSPLMYSDYGTFSGAVSKFSASRIAATVGFRF